MNYQILNQTDHLQKYQQSILDPEKFWEEVAENFVWKKKWDKILNWRFSPFKVEWFINAKLNITENCLDRHLAQHAETPAIIWEPNNTEEQHKIFTYKQLHHQVMQFANVLKNNGVKKGDRVCIYMGMIPELAIATLACARIGAIHSIIFGGFSAQSITDRINDAHAEFVITADGAFRGAKSIELKNVMDEAIDKINFIKRVIVFERTYSPVEMKTGRDVWWHDEIAKVEQQGNPFCEAEAMDAEDILFILYTSGSTGKPKGVVHTTAGYMVWANYTFVNVFQYQKNQIHFCTADIGWITGHSYILYGPLSAGATSLMFEGIPTFPDASRFWNIIEKFKVDIFYTAPTAIRSLMAFGTEPLKNKNLSSLKVLGSVGEPINEEAWHWFNEHIGNKICPLVDTWWQTETGGIMISNLANINESVPSYATLPLPGIQPCLVDEHGNEILENNASGNLCIKFPWPGMIRTMYGDHARCEQTYFSTYKNYYFTGDGSYRNEKGYYRITGRVDDVLNVSGHRLGTAEIENAINSCEGVIESAVVGYPHEIKGQGIYAYVIFSGKILDEKIVIEKINKAVSKIIGAIAKPDKIQLVNGLPKTRSGKIMRRILRKIAEGEFQNLGDTSTLLDPSVVESLILGKV